MVLTVAAMPIFIEYVRHFDVSNTYWLASSTLDVVGMFFVCAAFVFEETRAEVSLGMIGAVLLLGSDCEKQIFLRFPFDRRKKKKQFLRPFLRLRLGWTRRVSWEWCFCGL